MGAGLVIQRQQGATEISDHVEVDVPRAGSRATEPAADRAEEASISSEWTVDPRTERNRQRKRPWSQMSMIDGSPLRIPVEGELDVDGDPFMRVPYGVELAEARVQGLTQAGHGFMVEKTAAHKPVQVHCRYCGDQMYGTGAATKEWLCEFGESPLLNCQCNWCLHRDAWLAGEFRGRGRPRIQCGSPDCKRKLAAERKRRSRARNPVARACHV